MDPRQAFLGKKLLRRREPRRVFVGKRADMKLNFRQAFPFARHGEPAACAESAQPAGRRIELGYLSLCHVISVTSECDEGRNGAPVCRRQLWQWHHDTSAGSPLAINRTAPQRHRSSTECSRWFPSQRYVAHRILGRRRAMCDGTLADGQWLLGKRGTYRGIAAANGQGYRPYLGASGFQPTWLVTEPLPAPARRPSA
jgi:hypothetical protein